jgi:hypothetical protein
MEREIIGKLLQYHELRRQLKKRKEVKARQDLYEVEKIRTKRVARAIK